MNNIKSVDTADNATVDWLNRVEKRCRDQIVWLRKKQKQATKTENKIKYGVRRSESKKRLLLVLDFKSRIGQSYET